MPPREIAGSYARTLTFDRSAVNEDARTVEVAISSEAPVERWFGIETLGHGSGEVDLSRMKDGAPLLMDHDCRDQVGVVESVTLDKDRVLRGVVRFSKSARAQEVFQDVLDGIRTKISVGYQIQRYEITKGEKGAPDQIRVTRWLPLETSFVSVPADNGVGVGRALNLPAIEAGHMEDRTMPPETAPNQAAQVATPPTPAPAPEARALITPEVRSFLASAEKTFGTEGRTAAEEILGQTQDLGRAGLELLKRMESKPLPAPAPSLQDLGASEREMKGYSYARAMAALLEGAEGRQAKRGFEHEVSDTLSRKMPMGYEARGGILVPMQVRALDTATAGGAAELVFTEKGELIPMLRNASVALKLGARFLSGLTGPLAFPKQTAAASASWVAENPGTDTGATQFTTGTVTLSPKTLRGVTQISRQLLYLSSEDAESMIREDLAQAHALAYDKAVLHGTGADNQPTGIYAASGVNAVAFGGVPTFAKLVEMISAIAADNALLGNLGFVTTPGLAAKMMTTLKAAAAGSEMLWEGKIEEGMIAGYKAIASNQVSATLGAGAEHGIIGGNWAQVLMGQFGPGFELIVDPYALKKQALIEFTSFQMVDIALRYAEAFAKGTGATVA
nr:phage major capsid protein [uncultured Holophaga sp.]